jgi:hypothetical protein
MASQCRSEKGGEAMADRVVPMIHVPDVRATVDWYQAIGFTVVDTFGDGFGGLSFAILSLGSSQVMFNQDGRPSTRNRREVDLYVYMDKVDDVFQRLRERVEVVEGPHDTSYGMREFIIRDLNRFWITFGQASASGVLMNGVREGDLEAVRRALETAGLEPQTLTAALATASAGEYENEKIAELLEQAGAVAPPHVDAATLRSYVGEYAGEQGLTVSVTVKYGALFVVLNGQPPQHLIAIDTTTFRPAAMDASTVTFHVEAGRTTGFGFRQGTTTTQLRRVED